MSALTPEQRSRAYELYFKHDKSLKAVAMTLQAEHSGDTEFITSDVVRRAIMDERNRLWTLG